MANEFNYEGIFGSDFSEIRDALDDLPIEVETMLLGVMDSMVFQVENFATNLERSITQMTANGISNKVALQTLKNDQIASGRIFGQLKNDTKASVAMGMSNSGRMGQYADYTSKDIFQWVTVQGHKVCIDCAARSGLVMPYNEWESEGLPGSGWSVCGGYCYCVLDPTGKASDTVLGTKVSEPGAVAPGLREGKRFVPLTYQQAKVMAKEVLKGAGLSEKQITDMIVRSAKNNGGTLEGLQYKLKGTGSTTRKIMLENIQHRWGRNAIMREDLNDLNRYTMLFDEANYTRSVKAVIAEMEKGGFKFVKIKNVWNGGSYKGINCNLRAPDGRIFEMQFHTPESLAIKNETHLLYERARRVSTTEAMKRKLNQEMRDAWSRAHLPSNVSSIDYVDLMESVSYGDSSFTWDYYY